VSTPTDDQRRAPEGGKQPADEKRCKECGRPHPGKRDLCLESRFMPSPWAAAVAVMGMLTLGVMLGSATSQVAQSAGLTSIVLEEPAATPPPEEPEASAEAEPSVEPEVPTAIPSAVPSVPVIPEASEPLPEATPEPTPPPEFFEEEEVLPPVKHVFLIVLGENSYEEAFGETATAPYLAQTLAAKGELLSNYYAVTKGGLANQIALLSGQGPTAETALGCPNYTDIAPDTLSVTGQVEGSGCVYPKDTPTLPGRLVEKELTWKAYVEDLATPCAGAAGSRDPVVYFRALLDEPKCAEHDVSLEQLAPDLKTATKTPSLSYIVPNDCHDGGELPCEEGKPVGAQASEEFLQRVVPAIEASPAYREGGLIAITSAQARQTGAAPDASSCCIAPVYPNLPPEAAAPETAAGPVEPSGGGGRVGLLLISPFVAPGSVNESGYYNHYSLLLSLGELFELEPPGYASEIALTPFDASVYNAESTEALPTAPQAGSSSSASCRDCASRTPSADQSSPSSSKKPWRAVFDLNAIR
jgi:hypothetical protein